jgi:histidyl-tRNA synthetase
VARLGIAGLRLEINTLGTAESRARYREALVGYLTAHRDQLDEDSVRRLAHNPLRILDSKNPAMRPLLEARRGSRTRSTTRPRGISRRCASLLDAAGIAYTVNPRLVRGLDYYGRTVFEWTTDRLGAQGAVCAGGRYDRLIEHLGGQSTPAIGFALGIERVLALLEDDGAFAAGEGLDAWMILVGEAAERNGRVLAESLRDALPGLRLCVNCGGGSFKAQFKRADRSGARIALILGDDEAARGEVGVKFLREDRPQAAVAQQALARFLNESMERSTDEQQ